MREIKVRAFDKKYKRMYYSETGNVFLDDSEWKIERIFENSDHIEYVLVDGKKVFLMQYTGLKDKNGVEIYGGDIVTTEGCHGETIVSWDTELLAWVLPRHQDESLYNQKGFEVIGNIYENP